MDIVRLPIGRAAPAEADCIRIQEQPEGTFVLEETALLACGDTDEAESVSLISGEPYGSPEAAEAAGLTWASEHCVAVLHVSRSDGTTPLPDFSPE